jgi:cell wall-associated NlpC family hydrolase
MAKLRRGGFIFLTWKGDHGPRHVHVYRGGRLVLKWDLDNEKAMAGKPTRRVLELIRGLRMEGLL